MFKPLWHTSYGKDSEENKWISLGFKLNNFKYCSLGIQHYETLLSKYVDPSWSLLHKEFLNENASLIMYVIYI